jgi:hypothetical protein
MAFLFGAAIRVYPQLEGEISGGMQGFSAYISPVFSFVTQIYNASNDTRSTTDVSLPAVTLVSSCGNRNEFTLPIITLSASCHADYGVRLSKAISAITLSANSFQDGYCNLDTSLPAIILSASGREEPASSLSRSIPAIRLTAKCFGSIYGSLDKSIGAITLEASSHETGECKTTITLPAIMLSARIRGIATEIFALALNTKNFGLTKYTNYDYNSLCVFNGIALGAKRGGIYSLSGLDDDGTAIPWKIRSGKIGLGDNKLRNVWLLGKLSGDLKLIIETAEGDRYEYDAEPVSETEDAVRIKVGRGLDTQYVVIEFQNESDQMITIDKIQGYGVKL